MQFFNYFRGFGAIIVGILGFLFGAGTPLLYALLGFIVIDYVTGVMRAGVEHKLSSEVGAKGIIKKVVIVLIVSVAHLVDAAVIKEGNTMQCMVAFFYLANEGLSILENAVALGLPVPKGLEKMLIQLRDKENAGTSAK